MPTLIDSKDLFLIGWVVGFVDGEGCFSVSFNKQARLSTGIEVRPSFSISQNAISRDCIEAFREYFDCGATRYSANDNTWKYEIRNLADIITKVIPFFTKYPLKTAKQNDFLIFAQICLLVRQNQHRNFITLEAIIIDAYTMNPSETRKLTQVRLLEILRNHPNHPNNRMGR